MSPARIIVLIIALAAGGAAALMMGGNREPQVKEVAKVEAAPTVEVMVAAADIPLGNTLQAGDIRWTPWPADAVPAGVIKKDEAPEADKELVGQVARAQFFASEPIRRERLMRTDGSGFLSAVLPSGKRAVAITTDNRGANTAGGFILPNDRVDVVRTSQQEAVGAGGDRGGGGTVYFSETILVNVKVLAIGQNVQEKNGEKVVVGETATLELDPRQVETVVQAQRMGTLSLSLRSLQDARESNDKPRDEGGITLVRYGVTLRSVKQ